MQNRLSKGNQTNVSVKVAEWHKQHLPDPFYFRPYAATQGRRYCCA